MKPAMFLRIAAVLALLQGLGHGFLFTTYVPMHGAEEAAVVDAMRSNAFSFSGHMHSYWDMYFGYGLMAVLNCFIEAALFWQLAGIAKSSPRGAAVRSGLSAGESGVRYISVDVLFPFAALLRPRARRLHGADTGYRLADGTPRDKGGMTRKLEVTIAADSEFGHVRCRPIADVQRSCTLLSGA